MRVEGSTVLITGAAGGIGEAAVLHFLKAGCKVTALDLTDNGLRQLTQKAQNSPNLLTVRCDVTSPEQQAAAFEQHVRQWGCLDVAILNAGIAESGDIFSGDSATAFQKTLDVDLGAVLTGVHLASREMQRMSRPGVILSIASAAGVFALPDAPVYSAAKGGLVHFTRSAAPQAARLGLRLCTVCPQFVDTNMVADLDPKMRSWISSTMGSLLTRQAVVDELHRLVTDDSKNGIAFVMLQNGKRFEWAPVFPVKEATRQSSSGAARRMPPSAPMRAYASQPLPPSFQAWQVQRLSTVFTEATELVTLPMPGSIHDDEVLVRRVYTGANASDINFTSGKYFGSTAEATKQLPFISGFESVGVVVKAGAKAGLSVGQAVATLKYGGFSEYVVEKVAHVIPVAEPTPAAVVFLTSGLTASIALEEAGRMTTKETVLVTAAAGGTGVIAVQLAKLAGNYVIGTCGSSDKAALLKRLGVDRVINYKQESLKEVLRKEHPRGVDVVYESVGGDMFQVAVDALANKGRLIVIGMMSQYGDGWQVKQHPGLPEKLLKKSATISGFFLPMYARLYKKHLARLFALAEAGKLEVVLDPTSFEGVRAVPSAVQHLQSGASSGKVVVQICSEMPPASVGNSAGAASKL